MLYLSVSLPDILFYKLYIYRTSTTFQFKNLRKRTSFYIIFQPLFYSRKHPLLPEVRLMLLKDIFVLLYHRSAIGLLVRICFDPDLIEGSEQGFSMKHIFKVILIKMPHKMGCLAFFDLLTISLSKAFKSK